MDVYKQKKQDCWYMAIDLSSLLWSGTSIYVFMSLTYITHIQLTKIFCITSPSPYSKKLIYQQLISLNMNIITQNSLYFSPAYSPQ